MSKNLYDSRNGSEYYSIENGKQQYCVNANGHQIYAKDADNKEFYATDENQQQYYAQDASKNQYYLRNKLGVSIPISRRVDGEILHIYAVDADSNEIYPKSFDEKEYLIRKNNSVYYAKDKSGIALYPKNRFGLEYVDPNLGQITLPDGKIKPPIGQDQRPVYSKSGNAEVYYKHDNKPYFCKNKKGDEIYAKDDKGNEYYPESGQIAKDCDGNLYYALDSSNYIIYPTNEQGEYYITTHKGSYHLLKSNTRFLTYARQGAKQIYPIKVNHTRKTECVIDVYATINKNGSECEYYPKDSDYNEYAHNGNFIEKEGYPITSDGYIIIPNVDNKPKFIENKIVQYTKLLYRPDFKSYDFLTNVLSTRKGEGKNVLYKTLNITTQKMTILHYIIAFLIIINILLLTRL